MPTGQWLLQRQGIMGHGRCGKKSAQLVAGKWHREGPSPWSQVLVLFHDSALYSVVSTISLATTG